MYPKHYFETFWRPDLREEVFVAVSFDDDFVDIREDILRPAVELTGLKYRPVNTSAISANILTEIEDGIGHARLVLADLTAFSSRGSHESVRWFPNANVMYEVGIAHAVRHPAEVILVRACESDSAVRLGASTLPFDISPIRVHPYDRGEVETASQSIAHLIRNSLAEVEKFKGLLMERAIASLDATCMEMIAVHANHTHFGIAFDKTMRDLLSNLPLRLAVGRMLDLRLISFAYEKKESGFEYSYHWTDFGRAVIRQLGYSASE